MLPEKRIWDGNILLSIVVPVYNEEGAIGQLHREIVSACTSTAKPFEVIFVNDGSTDQTLAKMQDLSPLKIINMRKNFGQTAAMDAGIKYAKGRYIVTMDGDGQNDPKDITKLIKKLESDDLDVVSGWRRRRSDSFSKRLASKLAAFTRRMMINDGIHDSGCSLKIYK
ncbi:MAG: glycosyltransferase family 2 protein, partial [bacterium]|nr:glycosyltransferase family 2 protein [bacterium]